MKKFFPLSLIMLTNFLLVSCNYTDEDYSRLTYKPAPPVNIKDFKPYKLLFIDKVTDQRRKDEQGLSYQINSDPYILIPLWPWSHSNIDPVLRFSFFQEPFPLIIQGLIYTDVKASNIFEHVTISKDYYDLVKDQAYKLEITLLDATWSRYLTSYGLSYPGTILWALGLPVSYGDVYIKIKADLYKPNSDKPISTITIFKTVSCTEWVYDQVNYCPPISEFKLAEIFPEVMKDLRTFLLKSLHK